MSPTLRPFDYLDAIHRRAPNFHRNTGCGFAIGRETEEADRRVFVSEGRPADVEHIGHAVEVDGSIDREIRSRALRQRANQLHIDRDGSVLHRGVNARDLAVDDAVVCIDLGGLTDLNIAGLGLGYL